MFKKIQIILLVIFIILILAIFGYVYSVKYFNKIENDLDSDISDISHVLGPNNILPLEEIPGAEIAPEPSNAPPLE